MANQKNRHPLVFVLLAAVFLFWNCNSSLRLSEFKSDGCSLFPDKNRFRDLSWCECCVHHDYAYWKGGTEEERKAADRELRRCILASTRDTAFSDLVYVGVRAGGSDLFPNWYRWGYGWPYGVQKKISRELREAEIRKYGPYSLEEISDKVCGQRKTD